MVLPTYKVAIEDVIISDFLKLDFESTGDMRVEIEVINIDGIVVHAEKIDLSTGSNVRYLFLNNVASGVYFITFNNPFSEVIIRQFIVVR